MMTYEFADLKRLSNDIKKWGTELGFQQIGITDLDLSLYQKRFQEWLKQSYHGEMSYLSRSLEKRYDPKKLVPGTTRLISARMNYLPSDPKIIETLQNKNLAYISRYALGRDYHRLIRKRLDILAKKISHVVGPFGYRAFSDSAPVMEKPIAEKSGLGWIGKHTNLINKKGGSWFFLGTLFTDLPLPIDQPEKSHCGSCTACISICPTAAIIGPYQLDASRCISYLTIELRGSIPEEFRPLLGNRIYGCDDCQLVCPWNKFSKPTVEKDFYPRHQLNAVTLIELFNWSEDDFLKNTEGSAIRRIGYKCWLRNIAVALGNAPTSEEVITALHQKKFHDSALVREHVEWAIAQHPDQKEAG